MDRVALNLYLTVEHALLVIYVRILNINFFGRKERMKQDAAGYKLPDEEER